MPDLRQRILHARVQIRSWIMRPPIELARTHTILMAAAPEPPPDEDDAA